jgi:hypothetical protein
VIATAAARSPPLADSPYTLSDFLCTTKTSLKKTTVKVNEQLDNTIMESSSEENEQVTPAEYSEGGSEQPLPSSDNNGSLSLSGGEQSQLADDEDALLESRSAEAFWNSQRKLLFDASANFGKGDRQEDARQEDARQFHHAAKQLPYLPAHVRDAVNQIGNFLDANHDSHVGVHLSDAQSHHLNTISDSISDPTVRETFRQVFVETAIASLEIKLMITINKLMTTINKHVMETTIATIRVAHQLAALFAPCESDGTMGTNTRILMEADNVIDREERLAGNMPQPISPRDAYQEMLNDWKPIDDKISLNLDDQCEELKRVVSALQTYLDTAEFIPSKPEFSTAVYKKTVQKTVDDLYKQISVLHSVNQGPDDSPRKNKLAPGAHAFEVEGTQPWLLMILRLVSECATPPCTKVTEETRTQEGYRPIVCDELMDLNIEAKPGSRTSHGPQALLNKATDQNLSHMAKRLFTAFNFAGAGVPSHATCLVCNMAAVQVLHLRLENVGTPEVCLVLYKSDLLPLMSPSNYDKWAKSAPDARQHGFIKFRKLLFSTKDCDLVTTKIPSGYPVLLQLMQKRPMELFGPAVDAKSRILGRLLGTGSASLVFQHRIKDSQAVKVSRNGASRYIKNEVSILKKLNEHGSHPQIPKFIEHLDLEVSLGDLKRKLPACITGPVGTGLLRVCSETNDSEKYSWLLLVLNNLQSALTFMHEQHIFHRDVNPKNAIIVSDFDGVQRAVLIDYSIAFDGSSGAVSRGFCGTINYSHRELFDFLPAEEFKPAAEHDLASLGFTMSALVNGSNIPWRPVVGFPKTASDRASFVATLKERFEMAGKLDKIATYEEAREVQEGENLCQLVKDLLAYDEETYRRGSTRKRE